MSSALETILISGCAGTIGLPLAKRLSERYRVVGIDVRKPPDSGPFALFVQADIASRTQIGDAVRRVRADVGQRLASVVHLAAADDYSGDADPRMQAVNVQGTDHFLGALLGMYVDQFILASTMHVHAPCPLNRRIDESWPIDPRWPYPRSKASAEKLVLAEHRDMPALLLRLAWVYDGEGRSPFLVSAGEADGGQRGQAMLHLEDALDAFERAINRRAKLPPELALLIGEEEPYEYPGSAGYLHYALDITDAQRLLGWRPAHSVSELGSRDHPCGCSSASCSCMRRSA